MDNLTLYICGGVVVAIGIVIFDIRQKMRFKKVLNRSSGVEPLLMQQSAGKKLVDLQAALSQLAVTAADTHQKINQKLQETLKQYNSGQMPLAEYHHRLDMMLGYARKKMPARKTLVH